MAGNRGAEHGSAIAVETRMVVEYGITLDGVWLPLALLRRLEVHGPWSAPFTEATTGQERVLVRHALAEWHNQAGAAPRQWAAWLPGRHTVRADLSAGQGPHRQR